MWTSSIRALQNHSLTSRFSFFVVAIDFVQEHVLRQGPQDNESHFERWKDDRIANTIRSQYEKAIGHESSVKEKK